MASGLRRVYQISLAHTLNEKAGEGGNTSDVPSEGYFKNGGAPCY